MFKIVLAFLSFFCIRHSLQAQVINDTIHWSPKLLTWNDFKEKPGYDKYPYKTAKTMGRITIEPYDTSAVLKDTNVYGIKILAIFERQNSWVRTASFSYSSQKLLAHEQLHFDIVELYARKIRKKMSKISLTNDNYKKKILKVFTKYSRKYRSFQINYDYYTKSGKDAQWQTDWQTKVYEAINELEKFANPLIFVRLKN